MGRLFLEYLDCEKLYACKKCLTHIVDGKQLVSKVSIKITTVGEIYGLDLRVTTRNEKSKFYSYF